MKKISKILVFVLLLSLFTGCGKTNSNESTDSNDNEVVSESFETDESTSNKEEEQVESEVIRENGQLPDSVEELTENELKHYLAVVINAAIKLDMEVLKEYTTEQNIKDFQRICDNADYKSMWENTIGTIIYLEDKYYMVGKDSYYITNSFQNDRYYGLEEVPLDADYANDLPKEKTDYYYEKYCKNATYTIKDISKYDYEIELIDGKIIIDVDEIFSCLGYGDLEYNLSPDKYSEDDYKSYSNLVFANEYVYLDLSFDSINDDGGFDDWEMYLLTDLDDFVERYTNDSGFKNDNEDLYYKYFKAYIIDENNRKLAQKWMDENVIVKRGLSTIDFYYKIDINNTATHPYYSLSDSEKELIKDLPLYKNHVLSKFTTKEGRLQCYYDMIQEMIKVGVFGEN